MNVTLNKREYQLKQSFRSLMTFEKMTGKNAFEVNSSMNDSLTLFFCMVKEANRETFNLTFDEFLDAIDDQPEALTQFNAFMLSLIPDKETAVADKKKAETR